MTAHDIIKAALRLLTIIAAGQSPSAEESADCLAVLNRMVGGWNEALSKTLAGSYASVLYAFTPLATYNTLDAAVTLSLGWQKALIYSLACDLAPEFGRPLPVEIAATAQSAKAAVMTIPGVPGVTQ